MQPRLILASTSRYRAELLARLGVQFECLSPGVEETEFDGELPAERSARLAELKAQAVFRQHPHALVIGSDQVACLGAQTLHKPGSAARQREQLAQASGQTLHFHTALSVLGPSDFKRLHVDLTECRLRSLSEPEIARYCERESAVDCAGGFRIEALGISLFDKVNSVDPSALIGLPLIALTQMLREFGLPIP